MPITCRNLFDRTEPANADGKRDPLTHVWAEFPMGIVSPGPYLPICVESQAVICASGDCSDVLKPEDFDRAAKTVNRFFVRRTCGIAGCSMAKLSVKAKAPGPHRRPQVASAGDVVLHH